MSRFPRRRSILRLGYGLAFGWLLATGRDAGAEPPAIARQLRPTVYETLQMGGARETRVGCCLDPRARPLRSESANARAQPRLAIAFDNHAYPVRAIPIHSESR
jgi:hypothetical protein